jgi:site-specific DNA-methyltransferase (adenine-specific)
MPGSTKIVINPPSDPVHRVNPAMLDAIHHGDCVTQLRSLPDGCIQLAFADPPFNIGYDYDVYEDSMESQNYLSWCEQWISELYRILIPTGSFWLAIGDEYAAELKILSQKIGFHSRSWVVWYYTFGVHCKNKFTRSHAHLFYFVKDPNRFTFHADAIAVPSARQLVYADARANPNGRLPDDTWILRPQDCLDGLTPHEDTWYFPRVNGTFKERAGFHGCQMPEQLLGRIIRACSNPEDVVLDPFSGSATTLAVAKKLGRHFLGFDLSEDYIARGTDRIDRIVVGQPLDGAVDPKTSAPATKDGKQRGQSRSKKTSDLSVSSIAGLPLFERCTDRDTHLTEAFGHSHRGASVDRLIIDPILNEDFQRVCDAMKIEGSPFQRNRDILRLRRSGNWSDIDRSIEQIVAPKLSELDAYLFASEIAWKRMSGRYSVDLVELLCDPRIASEFDSLAMRYCPGYTPLEYRWGALILRDTLRSMSSVSLSWSDTEISLDDWERIPGASAAFGVEPPMNQTAAVYTVEDIRTGRMIYVGETFDLQRRIRQQFGSDRLDLLYDTPSAQARIRFLPIAHDPSRFLGWRTRLMETISTEWNI